jgi:NADH-quinone oxidoreductase subunit E
MKKKDGDERVDLGRLEPVLRKYGTARQALIPILQGAQAVYGYLPPEVLVRVAGALNLSESTVYGVATFYAQFYLTRQGRHNVKVCRGTACHVRGSGEIMSALERQLGIPAGGTTKDYRLTLERVACVGSCALAPAVIADGKVCGRMTTDKTLKMVKALK